MLRMQQDSDILSRALNYTAKYYDINFVANITAACFYLLAKGNQQSSEME